MDERIRIQIYNYSRKENQIQNFILFIFIFKPWCSPKLQYIINRNAHIM